MKKTNAKSGVKKKITKKQQFWYTMEFYENIWVPDKFVFYGENPEKLYHGNGCVSGPFRTLVAAKKDALKCIGWCLRDLYEVQEKVEAMNTIQPLSKIGEKE